MLNFNNGGLISYVKSKYKVLYLLAFFYLMSFTFANLDIFIAATLRKMEKLCFLNIFKTISKIDEIILRMKVKTPVQTGEGIKSYHQKTCQLSKNIFFLKLNFAK